MRKRKHGFLISLIIVCMAISMNVFAAEGSSPENLDGQNNEIQTRGTGCSDYNYQYSDTPYCSNEYCPGGFNRRYRTDHYKRVCVRSDGSTYEQYQSRNVYVACNC